MEAMACWGYDGSNQVSDAPSGEVGAVLVITTPVVC